MFWMNTTTNFPIKIKRWKKKQPKLLSFVSISCEWRELDFDKQYVFIFFVQLLLSWMEKKKFNTIFYLMIVHVFMCSCVCVCAYFFLLNSLQFRQLVCIKSFDFSLILLCMYKKSFCRLPLQTKYLLSCNVLLFIYFSPLCFAVNCSLFIITR